MRTLSQMELQSISGGDLDKPLLQSSFKDVATFFGIYTGFKLGWETGSTLLSFSVGSFNAGQLIGNVAGGVVGASVGGLIASAAVHYVIPAATGLVGD